MLSFNVTPDNDVIDISIFLFKYKISIVIQELYLKYRECNSLYFKLD